MFVETPIQPSLSLFHITKSTMLFTNLYTQNSIMIILASSIGFLISECCELCTQEIFKFSLHFSQYSWKDTKDLCLWSSWDVIEDKNRWRESTENHSHRKVRWTSLLWTNQLLLIACCSCSTLHIVISRINTMIWKFCLCESRVHALQWAEYHCSAYSWSASTLCAEFSYCWAIASLSPLLWTQWIET